jgi:hypothetical protein
MDNNGIYMFNKCGRYGAYETLNFKCLLHEILVYKLWHIEVHST